jgi:hypothetical protein
MTWTNILWFLIIAAIFYLLMAKAGCGAHAHGEHERRPPPSEEQQRPKPPEEEHHHHS